MDAPARPQGWYRECFRKRILELRPGSVLDVGCGDGGLLRFMGENGVDAAGVEPDEALAAALKQDGLRAECAAAEKLPFEDKRFDIVVSEFSAHHFRSLSGYFCEAFRVARAAVMTLDTYYDLTIPSQEAAAALDRLCKSCDREAGMIHHDFHSAGDFFSALPAQSDWEIEIRTLLRLVPLSSDQLAEAESDAIAKARTAAEAENAFRALREQYRTCGFSDDGAIVFTARRRDGAA